MPQIPVISGSQEKENNSRTACIRRCWPSLIFSDAYTHFPLSVESTFVSLPVIKQEVNCLCHWHQCPQWALCVKNTGVIWVGQNLQSNDKKRRALTRCATSYFLRGMVIGDQHTSVAFGQLFMCRRFHLLWREEWELILLLLQCCAFVLQRSCYE